MLFRKNVSRVAAGKGRAVLEGVWLDAATIEACFRSNPQDEEAAVQAGLTKWVEGKGRQPPTWEALIEAMEDAEIGPEHFQRLKTDLGLLKVHMCVIEAGSDYGCDTVVCEAADLLHAAHLMHGGTHAPLHSTQCESVPFVPSLCSGSPSPPNPSAKENNAMNAYPH